ncbi:hypothetical protein N7474_005269 [Penicillium riverlandense]|uniref:uncharacterized protein n=1 Tax=Penicillium riverlandense TaxID=1903569 RepID=UPI0025481F29|nr:uncharacterized protein N7474_005269 [Penicillium riverlandense]KAJ5819678.1 hypothetical protein N7474_005269 [Penicillium riverlandense]
MVESQSSVQPSLVDGLPRPPRVFPQLDELAESDRNESLTVQDGTRIRAPKPGYPPWIPMKDAHKDCTEGTFGGASNSGTTSPASPVSPIEGMRPANPFDLRHPPRHPPSPGCTSQLPPRMHSPASQIFERSVQEDMVPAQASSSIPAHIRTENYIPPVLEASSAAITDDHLDPDSVEIVTHSLHQSAVAGVIGASPMEQSLSSSVIDDHPGTNHSDADEVSSAHGALDSTDVRRLSFISFADVVNAEHAETGDPWASRDPSQHTSAPAMSTVGPANRSPSPMRSPASSHAMGTSPPTSIATSFKGTEMSPPHGARGAGSPFPTAQSPVSSSFGGELNIETMRQALRRTGSGELGGVASQTASAVGNDEVIDRSF